MLRYFLVFGSLLACSGLDPGVVDSRTQDEQVGDASGDRDASGDGRVDSHSPVLADASIEARALAPLDALDVTWRRTDSLPIVHWYPNPPW